jgi:hypothetical protein
VEVDDEDLVESREEDVGELNMSGVHNVLGNAVGAVEGGLEHMGESLVQVLNAHISPPDMIISIIKLTDQFMKSESERSDSNRISGE